MNRYRCLIVDDEELARELLATHLSQLGQFELVASCASAIEASKVLKQEAVDLLFLDIEMPVLKGTDFYQSLIEKPKVIFTTAYRDYALKGFELDAVDYLLKPIVFSRFFNAIEKFLLTQVIVQDSESGQVTSVADKQHVFVRKDRKLVKVVLEDIIYISGLKDYIEIHLKNMTHTIKSTLTAFETQLNVGFIRCHRSYIVNERHVTAITTNDIELGVHEIPIGDHYKSIVKARFDVK